MKRIAVGWLCAAAFIPTATWAAEPPESPPIIPQLNVPIPGLRFSGDETMFFAEYLSAIYRYAISIVAVIATVMFLFGAFQYLLGTAVPQIKNGKRIMTDAVVGMLLVLGANLILRTVNPVLANMQALMVIQVKQISLQDVSFTPGSSAGVASGADGNCGAGGKPISKGEMIGLAVEAAKKTGVAELPCFVKSSIIFESGGKSCVIGHDENAKQKTFRVTARSKFISSGLFGSGKTFEPIPCSGIPCQAQGPLNDDGFDITKPPDFNLDWRWSHGVGAGQSTIFPNNKPCPGKEQFGRGFRSGGKCYAVPELMNPVNMLPAMIQHYRLCWNAGKGDAAAAYVCYAGSIAKDNPIIQVRVRAFNACHGA